jgi:hypothetical protein
MMRTPVRCYLVDDRDAPIRSRLTRVGKSEGVRNLASGYVANVDVSQMTSSDVDDVARLINQLHPDQPGVIRPARERLSSSSLTSRCAASRLARSWSNAGSRGSLPKEYHSGSRARDRTPSASTNNAVSQRCTGPLARVGSRMRPIQALNSAGGEADSVRELSVTATGRCSANDRSAAAATRAVIRPSSR